jgi:hypothetical protein
MFISVHGSIAFRYQKQTKAINIPYCQYLELLKVKAQNFLHRRDHTLGHVTQFEFCPRFINMKEILRGIFVTFMQKKMLLPTYVIHVMSLVREQQERIWRKRVARR